MAFDPAGSTLATGHVDGTVRLWDPVGPALLHVIDASTRPVDDLSFSGDGSALAVGAGPLTIWDVDTRERLLDSSAIARLEGTRFQFVRYDPTSDRVITSVGSGLVAIPGTDLAAACRVGRRRRHRPGGGPARRTIGLPRGHRLRVVHEPVSARRARPRLRTAGDGSPCA